MAIISLYPLLEGLPNTSRVSSVTLPVVEIEGLYWRGLKSLCFEALRGKLLSVWLDLIMKGHVKNNEASQNHYLRAIHSVLIPHQRKVASFFMCHDRFITL